MAATTVFGGDYLWRINSKFNEANYYFVDYINVLSTLPERWGSQQFDPDGNFFRVGFRSDEGSRLSAYHNNYGTGSVDQFSLATSAGERLVFSSKFEFSSRSITNGTVTTTVGRESLSYRDPGAASNPGDDVSAVHERISSLSITSLNPGPGFVNGSSIRTISESTLFSFSDQRYFFSGRETYLEEARQANRIFNDDLEDQLNISESGSGRITNLKFVDKLEGYQLSAGQLSYDFSFSNTTVPATPFKVFMAGKNIRIETSDYVSTTADMARTELNASETFLISSLYLTPEYGSMEQTRAFSESLIEPLTLKAANVVQIKNREGFQFEGGNGNDRITGNVGEDTLSGGEGNDVLTGSGGRDELSGGNGDDVYRFTSLNDLGLNSERDIIRDFAKPANGSLGDKISLTGIDANPLTATREKFTFVTAAAVPTNTDWLGKVWSVNTGTSNTLVNISTDTDNLAEYQIEIVGRPGLTANEFLF